MKIFGYIISKEPVFNSQAILEWLEKQPYKDEIIQSLVRCVYRRKRHIHKNPQKTTAEVHFPKVKEEDDAV